MGTTAGMNGARSWITGAAVLAVAFLLWTVLSGAITALVLLFTAILLSAGLRPIVNRLAKRMPFGAAVGLTFGILILVIAAIGFILIQPLGAELVKLVQAVPGYALSLQDQFAALQRYIETDQMAKQIAATLAGGAGGAVSAIGQRLLAGPQLVAEMIGDGLLIVLLAVGWMLSVDDLEAFILSLMPDRLREDWRTAFTDVTTRLSAYVQGVVINGALVGIVMGGSLGP